VYDELSQFNVAVPVSEIITREERPMYELTFANGNSLRASEDHPLYVVGKGYASVAPIPDYKDLGLPNRLEVGDQVVNELGVPSRIVEIKPIEYTGTVYTFGNSRFYANGVLVY
jgi:intein/homing endonuclease